MQHRTPCIQHEVVAGIAADGSHILLELIEGVGRAQAALPRRFRHDVPKTLAPQDTNNSIPNLV